MNILNNIYIILNNFKSLGYLRHFLLIPLPRPLNLLLIRHRLPLHLQPSSHQNLQSFLNLFLIRHRHYFHCYVVHFHCYFRHYFQCHVVHFHCYHLQSFLNLLLIYLLNNPSHTFYSKNIFKYFTSSSYKLTTVRPISRSLASYI